MEPEPAIRERRDLAGPDEEVGVEVRAEEIKGLLLSPFKEEVSELVEELAFSPGFGNL